MLLDLPKLSLWRHKIKAQFGFFYFCETHAHNWVTILHIYVNIREQEPSEGVQEDDIDYKDEEEEIEPKGTSIVMYILIICCKQEKQGWTCVLFTWIVKGSY